MQGNGGVYAVKKRRKPVHKTARPPPPAKTNPSKRHRDRLNAELDLLTGLLPFSQEVRGRLDKLSVLRLSVGYLKVQSYFHAALCNRSAPPDGRNGEAASLDGVRFSEGGLLLQALNGFVLVVTGDGTVFYASPTIRDFLGFHQSDVVHQSVYELVHVDDRETFRCQLHFALDPGQSHAQGGLLPQHLPPENSSFLERSFCCRLRCLLDSAAGFQALNFSGRLKHLHLRGGGRGAAPPQLALFAVATPPRPPAVMELRTKTLIFQTKHRMDFAPLGIDTRGKLVLGYSEVELVTTGSGYQFIHAADMMYCADNHLRMIKTGDSGFTIFRLLTKTGRWLWVQASARVVFKAGRPDFIVARQRALTNEEGEENLRQRRRQLPFHLATGEGVLYDVFAVPGAAEEPLDPASLLGSLRHQDRSVYARPERPGPVDGGGGGEQLRSSLERAFLDSRALLSVPGQNRASPRRPAAVDLTSDAMMDSLERIVGDVGDGGMEGVEEAELRDWENALLRMNKEREEAEAELSRTLADDVFSYVEEALRRETGGLAAPGPDPTRFPEDEPAPAQLTPQGTGRHAASGGDDDNVCWTSTQLANIGHGSHRPGPAPLDPSVRYCLQQNHVGPRPGGPAAWQQQQPSHVPSGSCVYENRGELDPGAGSAGQNGPPPGPDRSAEAAFFCWSGGAQIPRIPLNAGVDPFAFPALPAGSSDLSQEAGPL